MKKLTAADPETKSADIVADNIARLRELFPEVFTEEKIDFEILKQLLGGAIDERDEKYGLNWHGKRLARQLALTPSSGTLRPCPKESVDWDTTQNLMIEGDNLEVLKLLQKSYARKVKLIYIDPPYNTGNDFVYPDDFQDNIQNYLQLTGQLDGNGLKVTSNTESSGRFHTDWLNMIYPRLKLARQLLAHNGLLFISIDDGELANVRRVCDELFGEEGFMLTFVWKRRQVPDSRNQDRASPDHEYVVCYKMSDGALKGNPIDQDKYTNPDNDPRGPWFSDNLTGIANQQERPNLHYDVVNPDTGLKYPPSNTRGWMCARDTMDRLIREGRILWPTKIDGRPRLKKFLADAKNLETGVSSWLDDVGTTTEGTRTIQDIFGEKVFPFSKPVSLITKLVEQGTEGATGIVLDFFAGSGTTGQAVMEMNLVDGGDRRFILVQLPEPTERPDFSTIGEIAKERLRRVGQRIRTDNPMFTGDVGFRVVKLDSSNIRAWEPNRDDLTGTLMDSIEHVRSDRSEQDLMFELLLKLGLDLTTPIEQRTISGKAVHSVGAGTLLVCLAPMVDRDDVEPLAHGIVEWHREQAPAGETTVVFRDSAFGDDVAKTNLTAILQQYGLDNVRSL